MSRIEKSFKNEKGELSSMIIESDDNMDVSMNGQYKLAEGVRPKNNLFKKSSILTDDIGFKSAGFARTTVLALIVSVVALLVMYLIFRFQLVIL